MPVLTATDVANRALDILGTQAIANIANDSSVEAQACRRNYDPSRRVMLRKHFWNFAIKQVELTSADPSAPLFQWTNRFALPIDFIRCKSVDENDTDFRIQGRYIYTNASELELEYVYDHIDVDDWDPLFFDAVAHYLAWILCQKITASDKQKDQVFRDLRQVLNNAKFVDSTEDPSKILDSDVWLRSRLGPNQGFVRDPMTDHG